MQRRFRSAALPVAFGAFQPILFAYVNVAAQRRVEQLLLGAQLEHVRHESTVLAVLLIVLVDDYTLAEDRLQRLDERPIGERCEAFLEIENQIGSRIQIADQHETSRDELQEVQIHQPVVHYDEIVAVDDQKREHLQRGDVNVLLRLGDLLRYVRDRVRALDQIIHDRCAHQRLRVEQKDPFIGYVQIDAC